MPRDVRFRTVAIVGTGLIGTSIGLALRKSTPGVRVIGFDRAITAARQARRRGGLTSIAPSVARAVAPADVIVLAIPLAEVVTVLARVFRTARPGALVMDVAGLKTSVVAAAARHLAARSHVAFAGGHPLAGTERAGALAARTDLFRARPFALCIPQQPGRPVVLRRAAAFIRSIGAVPLHVSARDHDRIVALTSALPQLISSAVALTAASPRERTQLIGPGLEGVIRLAGTPAGLWTHTLVANKRNVLAALDVFGVQLRGFRRAIERSDEAKLARLLRSAAASQRRLRPR